MRQGALINPTLGPPAELPLREGPPQMRRPEGRDLRGPEGPARLRPARLQADARPEGQGRQLPVVRRERRPEGQRLKEVETPVAPVQVRRIRRCIKLPLTLLLGLVPVTIPVQPVLIGLGGIGTALRLDQRTAESSIWTMMIWMMTRPSRRSRKKF